MASTDHPVLARARMETTAAAAAHCLQLQRTLHLARVGRRHALTVAMLGNFITKGT